MAHVDRLMLSLSCSLHAENRGDRSFLLVCEGLRLFGEGGEIVCLETKHCLGIASWDAGKKKKNPCRHTDQLCISGIDLHSINLANITRLLVHL